ncbi:Pentatricopeptide repeat-containing protein [Vitis vinifera]|uniref:Pentatricopeptide repeat-containing protein n=1 Tax=Vitis vinifera TaxID=29760 RepID=A0A438DT27_VITVI|nr:Pentatricopeptide repeat-containing protein [Vitis vinifera]
MKTQNPMVRFCNALSLLSKSQFLTVPYKSQEAQTPSLSRRSHRQALQEKQAKRSHFVSGKPRTARPAPRFSNTCVPLATLRGFQGSQRRQKGPPPFEAYGSEEARNLYSWNNMLSGYAKLGMIKPARKLFDKMPEKDVVSWNTMVIAHAQCGYWDEALRFYSEFRQLGSWADSGSWVFSNVVLSSSVLDAYDMPNGGDMKSANELFVEMPEKNPVSWTALISGYARNGMGHKALELFPKMMLFMLDLINSRSVVAFVLVLLGIGRKVFDLMGNKLDVVLWNTIISALAQHGCGEEAIQMLDDMVRSGAKPDKITFVVILNACSHSGLVQQGLNFFESMSCDYGIVPTQEHYACLIDLLGRAGCVCRIHGNIELGRKAAERLIELEPQSSAAYVLLSSIYAVLGRWESVQKVRQLMNERQVKKERAISWLEIENKVHSFSVSDSSHPLKEQIYSVLEQLAGQMEEDASLFIAQEPDLHDEHGGCF